MIVIVDYGMGNLRSVQKGFERVGHAATVSGDPAVVRRADKIVLPGVGAFADAMSELRRCELIAPVKDAIESGKPFLGICLGLQMLFETGYEDGKHEGLGVLAGEVVRFDLPPQYKVPHMGWNELRIKQPCEQLAGIDEGSYFYFVHSYYVVPQDETVIAAEADYPQAFTAAVRRENLFATQFHPEKSQAQGLRILENFARLD